MKRSLYLTLAIVALCTALGNSLQEPPKPIRKSSATRSLPTPFHGVPHRRSLLPAHNLQCWKAIPQRRPGTSPCV